MGNGQKTFDDAPLHIDGPRPIHFDDVVMDEGDDNHQEKPYDEGCYHVLKAFDDVPHNYTGVCGICTGDCE